MIEEKKNKFKPIIQEELQEFAHKVDKIVEYLTFKKKEDRNIKPVDPHIVKSQKYY
jgi:CRISPR/Cas system endoribonuclease Cas6 (RAMP superfamily)